MPIGSVLAVFVSLALSSRPVGSNDSLAKWDAKYGDRLLEIVLPLSFENTHREGVNWRFGVRVISSQRPPELWLVEEKEYGVVRVERRWMPDGFLNTQARDAIEKGQGDDLDQLAKLTRVTTNLWSSEECVDIGAHSKRLESQTIPLTPIVSFVLNGTTYEFVHEWVDGYRVSGRAYAGDLDAPRDKIPQWVETLRRICLDECKAAR
jgi:hypothetical protein